MITTHIPCNYFLLFSELGLFISYTGSLDFLAPCHLVIMQSSVIIICEQRPVHTPAGIQPCDVLILAEMVRLFKIGGNYLTLTIIAIAQPGEIE